MKKIIIPLLFILTLPTLLSLDPKTYDSRYYAKFTSPEGIQFLSYSKVWEEDGLRELYNELLKNKHGAELSQLQEVRVIGSASKTNAAIRGRYNILTNSITLYDGDKYTNPSLLRETLSHEYGHHFGYFYFQFHQFPFSKWAKLRSLANEPIRWDSFWNYSISSHEWNPQEIFAEDYVLLYGATKKVDSKDVYSNEAFYVRTEHENQELSNVLENKELQQYLETHTGITIDDNRLLKTPKLQFIHDNRLSFSITERKDVAYRLNLTFYEKVAGEFTQIDYQEMLNVTLEKRKSIIFLIDIPSSANYIKANVDIVDLNTSIGLTTDYFNLMIEEDEFKKTISILE
ncbi:hypothetical protein [Fredinandcohnia quinoae]|nr:hypothetical protein [Fredinandcohnia sp. SECRCQ15]